MSILKGILKYGLILIALLVGAVFICAAVMVLIPSVSLFGFKYVNIKDNDKLFEKISYSDFGGVVTAIEIDVAGYDVIIGHGENDEIRIKTELSGVGFYKTQYADEEGTEELSLEDVFVPKTNIAKYKEGAIKTGVITIEAPEVEGLVSFTEKRIHIFLPPAATAVARLDAKTTSGDVEVKNLAIPSVTLTSDSGNQTLTNVAVSELTSVTRKGTLDVGVTEGKNAASYSVTGNVTLKNKLGVVNFAEGINIGTTHANSLIIETDMAEFNLNDVRSDINYSGEAGLVNVKEVSGELLITSKDAKFNIENTCGDKIDAKGDGMLSLDIKELSADVAIFETSGGYITIGNLKTPDSVIKTNTGNVTLGKVLHSTTVETKSGNVKLDQKDVSFVPGSKITIKTEKGIITATDIVSGLDIDSDNGAVTVKVAQVTGNITIKTDIAKAKIELPIAQYDLVTASPNGTVQVNDFGFTVTSNAETISHVNHEGEGACAGTVVVSVKSNSGAVEVTGIVED